MRFQLFRSQLRPEILYGVAQVALEIPTMANVCKPFIHKSQVADATLTFALLGALLLIHFALSKRPHVAMLQLSYLRLQSKWLSYDLCAL